MVYLSLDNWISSNKAKVSNQLMGSEANLAKLAISREMIMILLDVLPPVIYKRIWILDRWSAITAPREHSLNNAYSASEIWGQNVHGPDHDGSFNIVRHMSLPPAVDDSSVVIM